MQVSEIPTEMDSLHNVISSINRFLVTCNIKQIEWNSSEVGLTVDVSAAVKQLSKDLSDIADKAAEETVDSSVTQITATNKELNERINAFMSHAQNAIDEQNIKEFCSSHVFRRSPGCARTDACYKRRMPNSTHMQVSKASHVDGPQLKLSAQGAWRSPAASKPHRTSYQGLPHPIAERINNLETHLKLKTEESSDIYSRLKTLENRLLAIEGTSPEYFTKKTVTATEDTKGAKQSDPRNLTLQEIDDRIRELKKTLHAKKRKMDEELIMM